MKLSACIILYNPTVDLFENIKSYIDAVEILYVIDNTPVPDAEIIQKIQQNTKIKYHANHDNFGIAKATNIACQMAIADSYEWIITFDQDSFCKPETIEILKQLAINEPNIAIAAPVFIPDEKYMKDLSEWFPKEVFCSDAVIASCSLCNLHAYKRVGGFNEDYFIDFVDTDYCFKLIENGYKIIQSRNAIIIHPIGIPEYFAIGKYKFWYNNHSPIRRYYITRNRFDFIKKYKNFRPDFIKKKKEHSLFKR